MTTAAEYEIRPYRKSDAGQTFAVFQDAVTSTASKDYTPAQIAAWLDNDRRNLGEWDRTMSSLRSYVACCENEIVGFTDVDDGGYIAMLFVAPSHGRQGVASALLLHIEQVARTAGSSVLTANVSITARPFFERHGFMVDAIQHPSRSGIQLTNFHMVKYLG